MEKISDRIAWLMFVTALAFFAFLYGFAAERYGLFPQQQLRSAIKLAKDIRSGQYFISGNSAPVVYRRHGARTFDARAIQPGLTLLTSLWPDFNWRAGIRLIDSEGRILHKWETSPARIWPNAHEHTDPDNSYVHGAYLFPNGDVLFNIEYLGLVRMDSCGTVKWRLNYRTHHSVSRNSDGNFWVSGSVARTADNDKDLAYLRQFPGLKAPIYEDRALKVSPDGKILTDISLLKVIYDNRLERYIVKMSKQKTGDLFHLNDIEALSDEVAAKYPLFKAGDIVVSLKYLNMIMVMDPETGVVKWYTTSVSIGQHDPDFTGDGWITIFDNNMDFTARGTMLGGSRIVGIRPHTGERRIVYPTDQSDPFYTAIGGKWQLLANGNMLIIEAQPGRVFESTPEGKTVWEWIQQPYDGRLVAEVHGATRYSITPEQVASWPCSPAAQSPIVKEKANL